jgi:hypothetical protein
MIFITVIEPRNREIYINGVYSRPLDRPTPTVVVLEAGSHIFQTLTPGPGERFIDFEGEVVDVPDFGSATIDLSSVVPPRPKGT